MTKSTKLVHEFPSFGALAVFAADLRIKDQPVDEYARGAIASALTTEIQERFGNAARLPPPLALATQERRMRLGYPPTTTLLMTGALRQSIFWKHTARRETGLGSDLPYALFQELGTIHIPARSFIASTAREQDKPLFRLYSREYREYMGL